MTSTDQEALPDPVSWVDRYGDLLFRFALTRVRDRAVAEDLVQDTLLAAIQRVATLTSIANERGWLIGILRHKLLDHFRRAARDKRLSDDSIDLTDPDAAFDDEGRWAAPPREWESPEGSLERDEFWAAFGLCIDALPENLRTTFALRELEGVGSDGLVQTLGTSKSNVWVMLSRARQRLRDCLENHWFKA